MNKYTTGNILKVVPNRQVKQMIHKHARKYTKYSTFQDSVNQGYRGYRHALDDLKKLNKCNECNNNDYISSVVQVFMKNKHEYNKVRMYETVLKRITEMHEIKKENENITDEQLATEMDVTITVIGYIKMVELMNDMFPL